MKNKKTLYFGLVFILILIALVGPAAAQSNVTQFYVCVTSDNMAIVTFAPDAHCKQQLRLNIASGPASPSLQELQTFQAHVREILIQMGLLASNASPMPPNAPRIAFPPSLPLRHLPMVPGFPPNLTSFSASSSENGVGVTVENHGNGQAQVTVRNGNQQSSFTVTEDPNDSGSN